MQTQEGGSGKPECLIEPESQAIPQSKSHPGCVCNRLCKHQGVFFVFLHASRITLVKMIQWFSTMLETDNVTDPSNMLDMNLVLKLIMP